MKYLYYRYFIEILIRDISNYKQSGDFIARVVDVLFKIEAPHERKAGTTPEKPVSVAHVFVGKPQTGTRDYGRVSSARLYVYGRGAVFLITSAAFFESDYKTPSFPCLADF